jgi:hypothetical protein
MEGRFVAKDPAGFDGDDVNLYAYVWNNVNLRWLVFGFSTYYLYAFVASILAALISSLIWNWY